jgi:hypothetical protein
MNLPYNWDFIQNNISPEKLAELRRRFMEEWGSGNYTKEEMIERYRMSERTFRDTIKRYSTSLTGSENHLSPLRFQSFNRKVF